MTPRVMRRLHLCLMVAWIVVGLPLSVVLRHSIVWLVALSVYAIIVGHASAFSAERPGEAHRP